MKSRECHQTGFGFDSHAFSTAGTLVLGGLKFPGIPSLKGHSDGDVLLHALIDALLGGAGLGDMGDFFPDTSARYKGIDSLILLEKALAQVTRKGFRPVHVDMTVVAEKPRLTPVKSKIKVRLARLLKIPPVSFNIKGKTPEGLLLFPSSGGILVWVVATLQKIKK